MMKFAVLAMLFAGVNAVSLTDSNFDAEIFGGKNSLVKFQAPW